jgi:hypothetical protein
MVCHNSHNEKYCIRILRYIWGWMKFSGSTEIRNWWIHITCKVSVKTNTNCTQAEIELEAQPTEPVSLTWQ